MATVALTGSDTLSINSRILTDLAEGTVAELTFQNDIAALKTGKDGNTVYALNESGKQCDMVLRVIRGSADDKFLNNLLSLQQSNFAGWVLMFGEFVKKVGDGKGNITKDTYIQNGGIFFKQVGAKSNVEGDTEQSVSIYNIRFSNSPRVLG